MRDCFNLMTLRPSFGQQLARPEVPKAEWAILEVRSATTRSDGSTIHGEPGPKPGGVGSKRGAGHRRHITKLPKGKQECRESKTDRYVMSSGQERTGCCCTIKKDHRRLSPRRSQRFDNSPG